MLCYGVSLKHSKVETSTEFFVLSLDHEGEYIKIILSNKIM